MSPIFTGTDDSHTHGEDYEWGYGYEHQSCLSILRYYIILSFLLCSGIGMCLIILSFVYGFFGNG